MDLCRYWPLICIGAALAAAITQGIHLQPRGKGKKKVISFSGGDEGPKIQWLSHLHAVAQTPLEHQSLNCQATCATAVGLGLQQLWRGGGWGGHGSGYRGDEAGATTKGKSWKQEPQVSESKIDFFLTLKTER